MMKFIRLIQAYSECLQIFVLIIKCVIGQQNWLLIIAKECFTLKVYQNSEFKVVLFHSNRARPSLNPTEHTLIHARQATYPFTS